MADTVISGANQSIEDATKTVASELTGAAGVTGDSVNTPTMPLTGASYDEFQKAISTGGTKPNGFSSFMDTGSGTTSDPSREALVKYAKSFLGTPYVWGGSSPGGFDCSGLVQYVAKKFGLNLPRVSYQQANSGTRTNIADLQAGDLVAWDENNRNVGADHIAFYIGNGYILEAPHTGAQVRIRKLGKNEGAWGVHLDYPS